MLATRSRRRPNVSGGTGSAFISTAAALPLLIAIGALAACVGALVPLADAHESLGLLLGAFVGAMALGVLFVVPVSSLPGITLVVTLLVPTDVQALPHLLVSAPLGLVPLGVWMIRAPRSHAAPVLVRILALAFGGWLIVSEAFAPIHTNHGWVWLITAWVAIVFAITSTPSGLDPRRLRGLFLGITTVLGVYAIIEGFILHRNILFGPLLEQTTWWAGIQHGVSYRATTLLGHPLVNGSVFAAAAVLAACGLVQKRHVTPWAVAQELVLVGAVLATHSRSSALALGVGIVLVLLVNPGRGGALATRRLVLLVGAILGAAVLMSGLQARNESSEGEASASIRVVVLTRAEETLRHLGPFGAGPGDSDAYRTLNDFPGSEIALENSYAELAVSLGVAGAVLFLVLLGAVVVIGLQSAEVLGEAAALTTILVAAAGFNAIEGYSSLLVLVGLFVISTLSGVERARGSLESGSSWARVAGTVR